METINQGQSLEHRVCVFTSRLPHLDINFNEPNQAELVSKVLAACSTGDDQHLMTESTVDQWVLTSRLQQLIAITIRTRGHRLVLLSRCRNEDCAETFEIPLDLRMFQQRASDRTTEIVIDDHAVCLHLPTGEDQRRWYAQAETVDAVLMAKQLVLTVDGIKPAENWRMPAAWVEAIGEQLEDLDALTVLQLKTNCPACGQMLALELDLEQQLLSELALCQRRMLNDIHLLASAYHWSEKDIMDLSPSRRSYYITRLQQEVAL